MEMRRADFAGSWYPGDQGDCLKVIEDFLSRSLPCPRAEEEPVGGIVPHAGWVYSGSIGLNVIKCLRRREPPDLCIIFGRHLPPGGRNVIMIEGLWETPLGTLAVDAEVAEKLASEFSFTVETPKRYEQDNTIELQLPFVKYFFPDVKILPLGLPPADSTFEIARRAAEISKSFDRKTIALGSTDLTHYGYNYGFTPKGTGSGAVEWVKNVNDKRAVDLMVDMQGEEVISEALKNRNACCSGAAAACIEASKVLGARKGEKVIYSTSYDVRPDSSFVGYAGVLFYV